MAVRLEMAPVVGRTCVVLRCNLLPELRGVVVSDTTLVPGQHHLYSAYAKVPDPLYLPTMIEIPRQEQQGGFRE